MVNRVAIETSVTSKQLQSKNISSICFLLLIGDYINESIIIKGHALHLVKPIDLI